MATSESDAVPAWLFRRLIGIVYLLAFWSMSRQVIGLIGHDGILPAAGYMDQIRTWAAAEHVGIDRFRLFPTVFWFSVNDAFLSGLCIAGMFCSVLAALGFAPFLLLPLLWLLYLSLAVVGQDFLLYQW